MKNLLITLSICVTIISTCNTAKGSNKSQHKLIIKEMKNLFNSCPIKDDFNEADHKRMVDTLNTISNLNKNDTIIIQEYTISVYASYTTSIYLSNDNEKKYRVYRKEQVQRKSLEEKRQWVLKESLPFPTNTNHKSTDMIIKAFQKGHLERSIKTSIELGSIPSVTYITSIFIKNSEGEYDIQSYSYKTSHIQSYGYNTRHIQNHGDETDHKQEGIYYKLTKGKGRLQWEPVYFTLEDPTDKIREHFIDS
ncbi:hypothetical protein M2132_000520 [Dysgonomonas sp. PH5-45]|uniref:hypothetical protein n=1 Tax=unclassified Dysgonomonas TaxID=2630389 RepID=UPI0024742CDA|nr:MULTISPECIES: hypothetical protein [unclassified Dysgonomonas]MDH6354193.1 hypothetical protein [Dysgonomonas sp. PH5-45]MDH6387094.1 hypothetical protein [Dysgonomonas sp. PH5-37]